MKWAFESRTLMRSCRFARDTGWIHGNAIFIDDSEQHVKGAQAAGLETCWHHPVESDVAVWLAQRGFELPDSAFRKGPLPV